MKISRRSFLGRASGLAVGSLVAPYLVRPAYAADGRLLFDADMEVGSFGDYDRDSGPGINRIKASGTPPAISGDRARHGSKSLKVVLNRATAPSPERCEISTAKGLLEFFKTHWIGFSIYVPSDWQVSRTSDILWQLHHEPADWGAYKGGFSPILLVGVASNSDKWIFVQDYVQTPESRHEPSDLEHGYRDEGNRVSRGAWTDWVIEYRPDWRSASDGGRGVTRIWENGSLVMDYEGPNAVNGAKTPYIKFGTYKSAWDDRNYDDPCRERVYYFDNFRASKGDQGSYELVDPSRGGGATPDSSRPNPPDFVVD